MGPAGLALSSWVQPHFAPHPHQSSLPPSLPSPTLTSHPSPTPLEKHLPNVPSPSLSPNGLSPKAVPASLTSYHQREARGPGRAWWAWWVWREPPYLPPALDFQHLP